MNEQIEAALTRRQFFLALCASALAAGVPLLANRSVSLTLTEPVEFSIWTVEVQTSSGLWKTIAARIADDGLGFVSATVKPEDLVDVNPNLTLSRSGLNIMTPLLALDLGQKTGWCLRPPNGNYGGGMCDFTGSSQRIGQRYNYFRRFLIRASQQVHTPLAAVVYEKVQFIPRRGGLLAAQSWAGFEAILTSWCEYKGITYIAVPTGTLKKDFTGHGHATKDDMIGHARALGWRPVDDNHADAIALMGFYEVNHEHRARRVPGHEKVPPISLYDLFKIATAARDVWGQHSGHDPARSCGFLDAMTELECCLDRAGLIDALAKVR